MDGSQSKLAQQKRIGQDNFEKIVKRLTAYAIGLFATVGLWGPGSVMRGIGKSPEDLAMDTILKLTSGELNYHRAKGSLVPYLAKVMERDFLDLLRRKAYVTTEILPRTTETPDQSESQEGKVSRGLEELPGASDPATEFSQTEFKERVLKLVQGEKDLENHVLAVLDFNRQKPQEIAELLEKDKSDILNEKKRLRRRLAELHGRQKS